MFDFKDDLIATLFIMTLAFGFVVLFLGLQALANINKDYRGSSDLHSSFNVESIEFEGEKGFWKDKRKVLFEVEGQGVLVYRAHHVQYKQTDNDTSMEVYKYEDGEIDRVVLYVGKDYIEETQTDYAKQFGENIQWDEE